MSFLVEFLRRILLTLGISRRRNRLVAPTLLRRLQLAILLAIVICPCETASAQRDVWAWMGGQSTFSWNTPGFTLAGVYGTRGVFAPGNLPGVRQGATTWTDKNGNLWLFGGSGYGTATSRGEWTFGLLNDLWEFNPSTNQWAFISGSAEAAKECTLIQENQDTSGYECGAPGVYGAEGLAGRENTPGSRELAVGWTDANGHLWLFGGLGFASKFGAGYFNDLWMFDPATREWAWMGGESTIPGYLEGERGSYGTQGKAAAGNLPGGRSNATVCTDAKGDFWLFGGFGAPATGISPSTLTDLWKFNPSTKEWVWISGSKASDQSGAYGTKGAGAEENHPGSREDAACWVDHSGLLWLFGGNGNSSNGGPTYLNDFWKFNPSTGEWTWVGGSNMGQDPGSYGNLHQPGTTFIPSAREQAARFTDASGRFWVFGGRGTDSRGGFYWGDLNDLWMFDPSSKSWTWMSGSKINTGGWFGMSGTYGILGEPSSKNTPGGRGLAAAWTDHDGNFWLFAGEGTGADNSTIDDSPNDLWEYRTESGIQSVTATPKFSLAAGSYTEGETVTISDDTNDAAIYYSTDASSSAPSWTAYTDSVGVTASETLTAIAIAPGMRPSAPEKAAYELPTATPVIALPSGTYDAATVKITCATPGAVIYYTTNGTAPTVHSSVYNTQIAVAESETISAMAVAPGSQESAVAEATYSISLQAVATNQWTWMGGSSTLATLDGFSGLAQPGIYGKKGIAAKGNIPGGREGAQGWTDKDGNMWLFGGFGVDSYGFEGDLNDFWKLNPATDEWAWLGGGSTFNGADGFPGVYGTKGQFAASNYPGSREYAATWVDKEGNFWMLGGYGLDGFYNQGVNLLNDLWEFNVAKGEWAWITGTQNASCSKNSIAVCTPRATYGTKGVGSSGNTPGGREETVTWVDAHGNLWMFGGTGVDTDGIIGGELNELWEFKPAEKTWIWMGGEKTVGARSGQPGVYGERGVARAGNYPGAREGAVGWTDSSGDFWLFAGDGHDSLNESGDLDDLWKYDPTTNLWTWIGGSDLVGIDGLLPGDYGMLGVPSATNMPGGRYPGLVWLDKQGNAWLFGGYGADAADAASPFGYLNDLWEFDNITHEWTWLGGSSQAVTLDAYLDSGVPGSYGTLRSPAAGNAPGGREETIGWTDSHGNLWLFGGVGADAAGDINSLNDVWRLEPTPPATPIAQK